MTIHPHAAAKVVGAGLLAIQRRRYKLLCKDGVEHAHRLVETIDEPWLYREVTT
jgi:hypothetical protein